MRYFNPKQKEVEPLIRKSGVLFLDTETRGVQLTSEIVMLIVCAGSDSFMWDTRNKAWPTWLNKYLADKEVTKVGHNLLFDASLIETQHGVRLRNLRDTMLQEKILLGIEAPFTATAEQKKKYSVALKHTLNRYGLASKIDYDSRGFATHVGAFTALQRNYGYGDVEQLSKLDRKQWEKTRKQNLVRVTELENEVLEVYVRMRVDGIGFDRKKWLEIAAGYTEVFEDKHREFSRILKEESRKYKRKNIELPTTININSPLQVKKLFAQRGIEIESYTDFKRQYSMNKVEYNDKLLDSFFEVRDFYQLSNTFGAKWLHENDKKKAPTIGHDGRIHPDFTQIISTGRSSCSNPNLQQLPAYKAKELKGGHPRDAFVARKGYTMVSADFSGQEFALMMLLAGETVWLEYIAKGYDTHSILTQLCQPAKWKAGTLKNCEFAKTKRKCDCPEHGQLRTYTKKIIFGVPYGKGVTSIAEDLAITYDQAKSILDSILRVLPRLKRWMETAKAKALRDNAVWTLPPFERYRKLEFFVKPKSRFSEKDVAKRFMNEAERMKTKGASKENWRRAMIADNDDWRIKNQGVNSPIQGSGADMLKLALVLIQRYIDKTGHKIYILLPIHDAALTECPDKLATMWKKKLADIMEEAAATITMGKRIIKSEIKSGKSWV